ncbi:MAG: PHP domain-containing protein [Ruminococcaceae bacterium]|nr:PHP domain-containing protein [Oscillospiraceae bacterium]
MKTCDLHCHSTFSDGTFTPSEIISLAKKQGLSAVALTDHNTTKGLSEFISAGKNSSVETVAGCEFSTEWEKHELHIVGLFLDEKVWNEVEDYVELLNLAKKNSNIKLIQNLKAAGYEITYDEVAASTDAAEFNRAHVAKLLVKKGYAISVNEAFQNILSEEKGYYDPPERLNSLMTIRFIKQYGGVAVLAHAFLNLNYEELEEFLPAAKEAGLDAMETNYSKFSKEETRLAKELAKRFDLKESGGSDFHGTVKPDIQLGSGLGNLKVPFDFLEKLRK